MEWRKIEEGMREERKKGRKGKRVRNLLLSTD